MNLEKFCFEYWIKEDRSGQKSDKTNESDFHSLIQGYQTDTLSEPDKQKLLRSIICKNSKVNRLFLKAKRSVYRYVLSFYGHSNTDINIDIVKSIRSQLLECFGAVLIHKVEEYLKAFEIERLEGLDNKNIMTLLLGEINKTLHYTEIYSSLGIDSYNDNMEISLSELSELIRAEGWDDGDGETIFVNSMTLEHIVREDCFDKMFRFMEMNDFKTQIGEDFIDECIEIMREDVKSQMWVNKCIAFLYLLNFNSVSPLYKHFSYINKIGLRYPKIIELLEFVYKFLISENLKDIYQVSSILKNIEDLKYLKGIQSFSENFLTITKNLQKIESIERIETRREYLMLQSQALTKFSYSATQSFDEPFATIWDKVLSHCAELIEKEINLVHTSAFLNIELKNKELMSSQDERLLYFDISNTGQELASDISIEIQCDSPALDCKQNKAEIVVIESGMTKEICFPVNVHSPVSTTIRGTLCFSDRARSNKKIPFSFPVSVLKESAVFREIRNPYFASNALSKDTKLFVGREDIFNFIDKNIITPDGQHRPIVCHGLRRTGKTSLLFRIEDRGFTDNRLIPVYVDMQGIDDEKDLYFTLSDKISEKIGRSDIQCRDFSDFKGFLKLMKTALPDNIIVLLMDEFEELQMRVEDKRMAKSVFSNIRHLMQHENKLIFVFCGTHKLEEMSADYWSIFFNTATYLKISYLQHEETKKLITEPVSGQLSYDELAVGHILKLTHGQPYLTQLICHTIVSDLNDRKKRNYATIDDADDAAERIISLGLDKFSEQIWNQAATWERLILSAAAEEMTNRQLDVIGVESLYGKIEAAAKLPRKEYMDTLNKLVSKDILSVKEVRYSFPVNLLKKWIAVRHPLAKVRAELG